MNRAVHGSHPNVTGKLFVDSQKVIQKENNVPF